MTHFARLTRYSIILAKIGAISLLVLIPLTAVTVGYTSRSQFCASCHIMEPYYKSWENSVHNFVQCVDCHYEPGLLETVQGKFKALSQLAKYVTATQGTKPWAEVSDNSCMREGCHSQRLLEGPIQFGRVSFDHRHHLLETRRGRRLRCTSCHSQIVQGSHITVTESSCFLCHFRLSKKTPAHGDCLTCHGPPEEAVQVGNMEFLHSNYVGRGVSCLDCHRNVTRGTGLARKNRCRSCHAAVAHIERFDDTAFIHENHITLHSVECSECHDEIVHNLPPREHQQAEGDCGQCHPALHQTQWQFFAGRGAPGVPENPSPMFLTRVDCGACHKDYGSWGRRAPEHTRAGTLRVAQATSVSCMRCHGPGFGGMLDEWRNVVDRSTATLDATLSRLEKIGAKSLPDAASEALGQARADLELLAIDGSHGAHNIGYTLDILGHAREMLAEAAGAANDAALSNTVSNSGEDRQETSALVESELDCARSCHVGVADYTPRFAGVTFPHGPHLTQAEMDCDACHEPSSLGQADHGQTTITPAECTDCHHAAEKPSCARCHDAQDRLLHGTVAVADVDLDLENSMQDLDCADCHTDLESETRPTVEQACVDCHDEDYREMVADWLADGATEEDAVHEQIAEIQALIRARAGAGEDSVKARGLLEKARACFDAVARGGVAHNVLGSSSLLSAAADLLDQCREILAKTP